MTHTTEYLFDDGVTGLGARIVISHYNPVRQLFGDSSHQLTFTTVTVATTTKQTGKPATGMCAGSKQRIASEMHAHIQDAFREAQIEILSPHYRAHRDGSPPVLPAT